MDRSSDTMDLGKGPGTRGLDVFVDMAFAVSILLGIGVLVSILGGRTGAADILGIYLFYSLILLAMARLFQLGE